MTALDDVSELAGYRVCECGEYVLELTFMQLGGQCWPCYETSPLRERRTLEVMRRGVVSTVRLPRQRRKGKRGSKGSRTTRQIRKHAERSALIRLKTMFPDAYELMYMEERVRRGLPVVPRRGTTTESNLNEYHAATTRGEP